MFYKFNMTSSFRNKRMKKQRTCLGKELLHLWMLFMCMSKVQITAAPSCGNHICLNWKIQNTRLVLICKVDALNFVITFYDPIGQETGFCVPYEPCIPLLHEANITKNHTLHEIIVTIPLNKQLDGRWTCTYGVDNLKAVSEVTVQNMLSKSFNKVSDNNNPNQCWILMMLWCIFGFTCSFLPLGLYIFVCEYLEEQKGKEKENEGCCQGCTKQKSRIEEEEQQGEENENEKCCQGCTKQESRIVEGQHVLIVVILSVTIIALPVTVGFAMEEKCIAVKEFAIYGAIVGVVICLLLNKVHIETLVSYVVCFKGGTICSSSDTHSVESSDRSSKSNENTSMLSTKDEPHSVESQKTSTDSSETEEDNGQLPDNSVNQQCSTTEPDDNILYMDGAGDQSFENPTYHTPEKAEPSDKSSVTDESTANLRIKMRS